MSATYDESSVEELLRSALAPIEPPEDLVDRLEVTLSGITVAATEELSEWELATMNDPRNWVRPATAIAAGGIAGAALLIVRSRKRRHGEIDLLDSVKELRQRGRKTAEAGFEWAQETGNQIRESAESARSRLND